MVTRVTSIDRWGDWTAAASERDLINSASSTATISASNTVQPVARTDRTFSFASPSWDAQLEDGATAYQDEIQALAQKSSRYRYKRTSSLELNKQDEAFSDPAERQGSVHPAQSFASPASSRNQSPQHSLIPASAGPQKDSVSVAEQNNLPPSQNQYQQNKAKIVPSKRKIQNTKVPAMVRDLFAHNDGPPISIHPSIGARITPEDSDDEVPTRIRVTRTVVKDHSKRLRNEPKSPCKSLNIRRLMSAEFKFKDQVKMEKGSIASPASSMNQSPARSPSQTAQPFSLSSNMPVSKQIEDCDILQTWQNWEKEKGKISKHINSHACGHRGLRLPDMDRVPSSRDVGFDIDDEGIHTFKPTAEQYSGSFEKLLGLMNETAGHIQGVVKVCVPRECILPSYGKERLPNILVDLKVRLFGSTMSQGYSAKCSNFYHVDTDRKELLQANTFRRHIQYEEATLFHEYGSTYLKGDSVWRERQEHEPFTEKKMMECVANKLETNPCCSLDEPGTSQLRDALGCEEIHLGQDESNGFLQSLTVRSGQAEPGLGQSSFHMSTRSGTVFPMRLGDFAACTLNYHHAGGPRTYIVVKPSSHQRLEEFICLAFQQDKQKKNTDPIPPTCSQFVSHDPVYIPRDTLIANGIDFTEVTQFEKEMLVIFPYAYYQGFNGAANIVEEIMYASKQWEVFHKEGLYVKCSKNCAEGDDDFDLSFAEKKEAEGGDVEDDDNDIRQPASKRQCLED